MKNNYNSNHWLRLNTWCCFRTIILEEHGNLAWWRHQMEIFSALLAICVGNWPTTGEFPTQRPVTRSFHVFVNLRLVKRMNKQWWCWRFETSSCPLWRQCNYYRGLPGSVLDMANEFKLLISIYVDEAWLITARDETTLFVFTNWSR